MVIAESRSTIVAQNSTSPRSDCDRAGALPVVFAFSLGRFFGQTVDQPDQAFADLIAGHYERAGLYGAYGDVNADVKRPGHQSGGDGLCPSPTPDR